MAIDEKVEYDSRVLSGVGVHASFDLCLGKGKARGFGVSGHAWKPRSSRQGVERGGKAF